jgi:hypothetical protein
MLNWLWNMIEQESQQSNWNFFRRVLFFDSSWRNIMVFSTRIGFNHMRYSRYRYWRYESKQSFWTSLIHLSFCHHDLVRCPFVFLTAISAVPLDGFRVLAQITILITIAFHSNVEALPVSHAYFKILQFLLYPNKEIFLHKLLLATLHCREAVWWSSSPDFRCNYNWTHWGFSPRGKGN